ncbi:hypothetical protein KPA97_07030, partial [Burkholderia cenocepacia]|nr:hypothetical protein [Burkholderia cenocepacia]
MHHVQVWMKKLHFLQAGRERSMLVRTAPARVRGAAFPFHIRAGGGLNPCKSISVPPPSPTCR